MKSTPFDAAYFRRFYFNRRTKVVTREEMTARAEMIAAILRDAQHPIRSILDAGCGIGMLKPAFARVLKRALCWPGRERIPVPALRLGPGVGRGLQAGKALRPGRLLRRAAIPG